MESLFRQTELEARIPLNMNVLDGTGVPRVMNLREVLQAFLDHRHEVLVRRSKFRLANIEHRLEILDGYLIVYLNIDAVIRIIRREDDPKAAMMKKWKLSDVQADSILNMRLRALRRLEEIEIKQEHDKLSEEKKELGRLLKDEDRRWQTIGKEITDIRARFGEKTELGRRRSEMGDAPAAVVVPIEALIERESLTIVVSQKGWVRAFKGHLDDLSDIRYKEGDGPRFALKAESTDKLLLFATNGRFYMVPADKLPRGRGDGENLKLMVEIGNEAEIIEVMLHKPGRKLLVAASDGRGFIVPEDEVVAQTRAGKQILNVGEGIAAQACTVVDGDTVAVQGHNRKLLLFKLEELPEMTRGRGVILQRYKQGGLGAVRTFNIAAGWPIGFKDSERKDNAPSNWLGTRGQAGLLPPKGLRLF
jgi:topoisomerase-4 subunit A